MAVSKGKPAPAAKAAPAKAAAPVAKPVAPAPKLAAAPAAKPATPSAVKAEAKAAIDAAERQRMIAEAAYYLAEKRGFAPGHHDEDWAEAERQIDALIKKK